jgi:HSP20 family molecular chaperone IbpA
MGYVAKANIHLPFEQTAFEDRKTFRRRLPEPVSTPPFRSGALGDASAAKVKDEALFYKLRMTLRGIDRREIYVIASPRSVVVEVRRKRVFRSPTESAVTECLDQRMSREFHFPDEIIKGETTVVVQGGILEIIVMKSSFDQKSQWSELVEG